MKITITDLDHPTNAEKESRISVGAGSIQNGMVEHALFFKSNGQSLTTITDRESLVKLRDGLDQYLRDHPEPKQLGARTDGLYTWF